MVTTATELLAIAKGEHRPGAYSCYFCGASCDNTHTTKGFVKDSFSGLILVKRPRSDYVCVGCVLSMSEKENITLIDGEMREGQRVRMYSWIITPTSVIAATKAHLHLLRELFLNPPPPPFSFTLTDSGQKHLLYRSFVCFSRTELVCLLEETRIEFSPNSLRERMDLIGPMIAATGKPAMTEPVTTSFAMRVMESYPSRGEMLLNKWQLVREEPLSALGIWLSPNKEDCGNKYPTEFRREGV